MNIFHHCFPTFHHHIYVSAFLRFNNLSGVTINPFAILLSVHQLPLMSLARPRTSIPQDSARTRILQATMLHPTARIESHTLPFRPPSQPQRNDSSRTISDRNMKFQLQQLDDKMDELITDIRSTRQQYRELLEETAILKRTLVYEDLYTMKAEMDNKISGLGQQLRLGRMAAEERYAQIRSGCKELWERTEETRGLLFELSMRVEAAESRMGFGEDYCL